MGIQAQFLMMMGMLICLTSFVFADSGTATFYDPPYTPSKCYGKQNNGNMVAGASDRLWKNGAACGKKYSVKCTGPANKAPHACRGAKTIVVKIVDYCARCNGTINLSRDAFSQIADPDAGIVKIEYNQA
ncbi:hypothetical protein F0562_030463 [Nyssa sinensis]|uniref:Expansin-like EG45 domain-containing protein n=1 Tax=Nyssa sinensis TaxID=561372 RepID=A0A5J5AYW1_9ASTE|nr:hypothetical protein F0562_030463 [Nyssa sinensis]